MVSLSAVTVQITVFDDSFAQTCYNSYTLPNTPFYFKIKWNDTAEKYNYSQYRILWSFGDGTTFTGPSATHYYQYPGDYNVKATLYSVDGTTFDVLTSSDLTAPVVSVVNAVPDKLIFQPLAGDESDSVYLLPAGQQSKPLDITRYNSWQNDSYLSKNSHSITLYASGCKSDFISVSSYYTDKWSHLRSYYSFVENVFLPNGTIDTKIVQSTSTTSTKIYATKSRLPNSWKVNLNFSSLQTADASFAGTSGTVTTPTKTVHFVDQKPSGLRGSDLVFLYAGFDTQAFPDYFNVTRQAYSDFELPAYGYINFKPEIQFLKSIFNPAKTLAITSNGITVEGTSQTLGPLSGELIHSFNIDPSKWSNTEIPFVITFKDSKSFTTKCYSPISAFNLDVLDLNNINIYLCKVTDYDPFTPYVGTISAHKLEEAVFKLNPGTPIFTKSGSYFSGTVSLPYQSDVNFLSAVALIKDGPAYATGFNYGFAAQPGLKNITRFRKRSVFSHCNQTEMSFTVTGQTKTLTVASSAAIPVSVAPLKTFKGAATDKIWIADSDNDIVYVYDTAGNTLASLVLSAINVDGPVNLPYAQIDVTGDLGSASPSNVAIDSQGYAWVALYDAVNCIKIHPETYVVMASAVPPQINVPYLDSTAYVYLSGFAGENLLLPSCVDTDTQDNIWVSYSHPAAALLIKYDSKGNVLNSLAIGEPIAIQEIIVDKNNNVWAAAVDYSSQDNNPYTRQDKLYKFDAEGNLTSGFPKVVPGFLYMTIDLNQNIIIGNSYSSVTIFTPQGDSSTFPVGIQTQMFDNFSVIGGVATDAEGYLWIIQNVDGKMYFYDLNDTQIQPLSTLPFGDLPNIQVLLPDGYQAFYNTLGDWTGIRWINKYRQPYVPGIRAIEGTSNLFAIYDKKPVINKKNENFDQAATFKSYILQESLFDKHELLDNFLGQIVGDYQSEPETLGKTIYEKIANFISNTSDPETCNVSALRSLFQQYGLDFNYFVSSYPPLLKRVVDLLSINNTKLFGSRNLYNLNFGLSTYGYQLGKNLGAAIPIDTGLFTVGKPIVAYERFSEKYTLITNTLIPAPGGTPPLYSLYPLSGVNYEWGWNLVTASHSQSGIEIDPYYIFYEYQDYTPEDQVDGVIDFTNELTTISPTNSSYSEWTRFGGIMDRVISRALYEGLDIIK